MSFEEVLKFELLLEEMEFIQQLEFELKEKFQ